MQRRFGLGIAFLAWMGASLAGQTIHGRDGITLPPPPAGRRPSGHRRLLRHQDRRTTIAGLKTPRAPETRAFIDAENAYTARYMKQARIRPQVVDDLRRSGKRLRAGIPIQRGDSYFFMKRLAGEQQSSIYVRAVGWTGKGQAPGRSGRRSARDPEHLRSSSTMSPATARCWPTACNRAAPTRPAIHVLNVKTGKTLEDELPAARYSRHAFAPDGASLYYTRNNKQGTLLYQHMSGHAHSQRHADLWPRVSAARRWAGTTCSAPASPTTAATWWSRSTAAFRPGAWTLSFAT